MFAMKVGVIGGGQLARMLALAAFPLGIRVEVFDPEPQACAGQVAPLHVGKFNNPAALCAFAQHQQVLTFEFENIPAFALQELARAGTPIYPPLPSLAISQDRLLEKNFLRELGLATAQYQSVASLAELEIALERIGVPAILKTRTLGYDGKGQVRLTDRREAAKAWQSLQGERNVPCILESCVAFDRELSILGVRAADGSRATYDLVENLHRSGVLHRTIAPAPQLTSSLKVEAEKIFSTLATALDYVGTLAIELFCVGGRLLVNEFAPRVHNSGHWTIEGAHTSQFENHLRAICGLPLGSTALRCPVRMYNLIGDVPDLNRMLEIPAVALHLYGKASRPGRKVGHLTLTTSEQSHINEIETLLK